MTKQPCLQAENEQLRAGYAAARLEIESLKERVQQLGQLARDVNSRRVVELEAQLAAVGAGGVEPLRKRCLHQISEPAKAGWRDGCSPDNCGGCWAAQAAPVDAAVQRDADRYRWLRTRACMGCPSCEGSDNKDAYLVITGYGIDDSDAVVDAAIDAARAAQGGAA